MTIQNGLGLAGFSRTMQRGQEGQPSCAEGVLSRAYRNPLAAQVTRIAIGTYADDGDTFTVSITLPNGTVVSETVLRASGAPADAAAAATALAAQLNARQALNGHLSAAVVSSTNVDITFDHPNVAYTVAVTASGVTVTATQQTAPGGSVIPFGRFVTAGASVDGQPAIREAGTSDTEDLFVGVTLRRLDTPNLENVLASAVDGCPAGDMQPIGFKGGVLMYNRGSVASAVNGLVYVVINTAGGQSLGQARADDDGSNSIPLTAQRAHWTEVVQPGALGEIWLDM